MGFIKRILNVIIRGLSGLICDIDVRELSKVPLKGPYILAGNHINFLDVPVLFARLEPRDITGLVKVETWKNPFLGSLFSLWGAIPIRRGEADLVAFRLAKEALAAGRIMGISPEGTRSRSGVLQQGKQGIGLLAVRAKVPIIPLVFFGSEALSYNLKHFRKTPFNVRVGNPFRVDTHGEVFSKALSEEITAQIMYQMAALLPEKYRGFYADLENARDNYLVFEPGLESNLKRKDKK
jgi:1-acyl-sn-glycerol-3-phosphate acyltransferase